MGLIGQLHQFHKTRPGYLAFALVELILLYIFASIAIDTANMWAYLASAVLFIGAVSNIIGFFAGPPKADHNGGKIKNAGKRA